MALATPSLGKTVTIASTVPLATQDLLQTILRDIWGFSWATPSFTANLMIVAVACSGLVMHRNQRSKESAELEKQNGDSTSGGPSS